GCSQHGFGFLAGQRLARLTVEDGRHRQAQYRVTCHGKLQRQHWSGGTVLLPKRAKYAEQRNLRAHGIEVEQVPPSQHAGIAGRLIETIEVDDLFTVLISASIHWRAGEQLLQFSQHHGAGGMCAVLAELEAEPDKGLLAGHYVSISTSQAWSHGSEPPR